MTTHIDSLIMFFRYIESTSKEHKTGYIKSALLTPVKAVREQVQTVWVQTDAIKNTVADNYHEVRDRSDCKLMYIVTHMLLPRFDVQKGSHSTKISKLFILI